MSHLYSADKRKHLAEIASLKKQINGEQTFSAELDEEHKKVIYKKSKIFDLIIIVMVVGIKNMICQTNLSTI